MVHFFYSVLYFLFCGVASHYIGEALPRKWFHWDKFPYRSWKWEKNGQIYEKIRIQNWKDKMPDMSRVMKDMVPKRLSVFPTSEEVIVLIRETCVAEATHLALCLTAPVHLFIWWGSRWGLFFTAITILGNLPFMMIQRYNRPSLVLLANRLKAREERRKNARIDSVG